jgi:N-acetylglucosaminyldiphosphoundecaprenol N-acetyl-beta-D-mannosaminyltransferase
MHAIHIGSLRLDVSGQDESLDLVRNWTASPSATTKCLGFLNPHVYNQSVLDPRVAVFLERCDAVCLDGVGAVLAAILSNRVQVPRVIMHHLFDAGVAAGLLRGRVVLLGLTPEDNARAARQLRRAAPMADFVAIHHGFHSEQDYATILGEHRDAEFVLVGMGSPRSERVLLLAADICPRALCWHVGGGSLRNWAGTKQRAPAIVSRLGLEWLHRMVCEPPTRERYTAGIPAFVRHLLMTPPATRRGDNNH